MRRLLKTCVVLLGLAAFSSVPEAAPQTHKDARLGYSIKVPKKWQQIPLQTDEQWIAAQFLADKGDLYTNPDSGRTYEHTPLLRVIAFVDDLINQQDGSENADEEKDDEEGEDETDGEGESTAAPTIVLRSVYQDYGEFLKETYSRGYYVTSDEVGEHAGLPVQRLEMLSEWAGGEGSRLLITWVYETDIGKIAIEFEILQDEYKKEKSTIEKTLKSFKTIARTEPLIVASTSRFYSMFAWRTLSPKERAEKRKQHEEEDWDRKIADLPDGWVAKEIKGVRVLNRADEKYAKEVVANIHGVYNWLEDTFPEIGPEEYTRLPVVRICKDRTEERTFRRDGVGWFDASTEIVTHKDTSGGSNSYAWGYITGRALSIWFNDRDVELYSELPPWLRFGLQTVVSSARMKGSKLKFSEGDMEQAYVSVGEPMGLEELMTMGAQEFRRRMRPTDTSRSYIGQSPYQAATLTRFFITGPGSKGKYKSLLTDYLNNLRDVLDEIAAEKKAAGKEATEKPQTEEEENELKEEEKEANRAEERRVLETTFERTFGSWSDKDLFAIEKAYKKVLR